MGVLVLSLQESNRSKPIRWLLDGRQRRDALSKIQENPEVIYEWAQKFIGFKKGDSVDEIEKSYWEKINEYLEQDPFEETKEDQSVELEANSSSPINEDDSEDPQSEEQETANPTKASLDLLLRIIVSCHNFRPTSSGFTRPFDLKPLIEDLPFADNTNGKRILNGRKLRSFILQFQTFCKDDGIENTSHSTFADYVIKTFKPEGNKHDKIRSEIEKRWSQIQKRIEIIDEIDSKLRATEIGIIEIKNISQADEQKIFNIINTGGTQLTAVEILSAKSFWNTPLKNPNAQLVEKSTLVYDFIKMKPDGFVRWDLPATLTTRLSHAGFIFPTSFQDKSSFESTLTIGFKLLAAIYQGGIKKESIENLSRNTSINWETSIDTLVQNLNNMAQVLGDSLYFQYFRTWRSSIYTLLGDAIALNFAATLYMDWERKKSPIGGGVKTEQFKKNGFILLDRFIYEHLKRQWRGSSDSRVAQNLSSFKQQPELLVPVENDKWAALLTEAIDSKKIDDVVVGYKVFTPFLYHFYSVLEINGDGLPTDEVGVDHIIPQAMFKTSVPQSTIKQADNLCNLALLLSRQNSSKGDKSLLAVSQDAWLCAQIKKHAFVDTSDYQKFSKAESLVDLIKHRRSYFETTFLTKRQSYLAK